jgi:hypothetical protein
MPIQAACPACGVPLQLPDDAVGRGFQCVRCGAALWALAGGQIVTQPQPLKAQANPFAEGPQAGVYGPASYHPAYLPQPMGREQALAKVRGPGITLIVYGLLWGALGLLLPLALFAEDFRQDEVAQVMIPVLAGLAMVIGAFTVFCGTRLMALRSYTLIMVGVVLTVVAGILICPLLAIAAIWPLVVLLDNQVKQHFGEPPASPFRV